MFRRKAVLALCSSLFVVALVGVAPAAAAPPDPVDDGAGKQWRQLTRQSASAGARWRRSAHATA